jgi:AcrR family transcriptional regulator
MSAPKRSRTRARRRTEPVRAETRRTAGVHVRGRAERVVNLVLRAAAKELTRVGYAHLRVEDVAARSGINKTTIYRRWPTKAELVAAALREVAAKTAPIDTGTLRGDLRESLREALARGRHPWGRGIMRILQTERTAPDIDALAHRLRDEQHEKRVAMVNRGIARGELPKGVDPDLVVDLVTAPVLRRVFTFGEAIDAAYIDRVLDVVLAGVAACSSAVRR